MSEGRLQRWRRWAAEPAPVRDVLAIAALGLTLRLAAVVWAAGRFPPVEDGRFYHVLATRIAQGHGYTWLWPDGVVTPVAHYPVGYPALLSAAYGLFGAVPVAGMVINAALGTLSVVAVHRIAAAVTGRLGALAAAIFVAAHPALVLYTPALMTEGVTAALLSLAGWAVIAARRSDQRRRWAWIVAVGALAGSGALIRGQTLLLAPLFGGIAACSSHVRVPWKRVLAAATLASVVAVACVLPWTARNCARMDRCVAVSANVGWNLLIGSVHGATGTFVPIHGETVPVQCRTVFGEADKDACFRRAAAAEILKEPARWLSLVPKKLSYTFDYCGAAGWYLHASNPRVMDEARKLGLGVVETAWQRVVLALALIALARGRGARRRVRRGVAAAGVIFLLTPAAWLSYLAIVGLSVSRGRAATAAALLVGATVFATALTHAVFFGAGRYSLPVFALVAALAGTAFGRLGAERARRDGAGGPGESAGPPAF